MVAIEKNTAAMSNVIRQFAKSRKGKFVLTGVPFVAAVVGGSYFLSTVSIPIKKKKMLPNT